MPDAVTTSLDAILEGYLDLRWKMNPVDATFHGVRAFDSMLADYSPRGVREMVAALRAFTLALEEADARTLEQEIDRTAALHAARHDLLILERERPQARNPTTALSHFLHGIFLILLRRQDDPAHRRRALIARLGAAPEFFARSSEALTTPVAVFVEMARAMVPGGLALVQRGIDDALGSELADDAEFEAARSQALEAMRAFSDALVVRSEKSSEDFAIGRDLFDRKLHTAHLIKDNADELARYGERLRAEAHELLDRAAAAVTPGEPWQRVVERLRTDDRSGGTLLETITGAMEQARDFTVAHKLMSVSGAPLTIVATPDFLLPLVPLYAYLGPGAFDDSQRGYFFVTAGAGSDGRETLAELLTTAVHEGVPGHHQQITMANRSPRQLRRILGSPASTEGWALYCETMMAEEGFLATPAMRLFNARHLLWRALRVVIDVGLHTRGMPVHEAERLLSEELGFPAATAAAEVRRYCAYPTYQLCYAVGRRDILALREDVQREQRTAFRLATFHDTLMSYGAFPTALARWGMLASRD